jgi:hypothetical protein
MTESYYKYYYCIFSTDFEDEYIKHGVLEHLYKPMFPNPTDLILYNLAPQGKSWEKPLCSEEEAERRLVRWVEKGLKKQQQQQSSR